jgi:VCBS repeat protein
MNTAFCRVGFATLAAALFVAAAPAQASTLSFAPPRPFDSFWSVAVGDFNRDGKPDVVGTNRNSGSVSVLLGNGNGTFGPKQDFTTGDTPVSVAVADLNRDGKTDLAVANCGMQCAGTGAGGVSVLLGNGDGTFGTKTDFETGAGPYAVAAADLNRDGKPDLVSGNAGVSSVSVLLGNGDGTFGAKTDSATGQVTFVAVGDFNRDAKPDLAVANGDALSVLLGNGDGTLAPKTDYPVTEFPLSVAVGDLNGDGHPDLAAPNWLDYNRVSVLIGNGKGAFGPATDHPACLTVPHGSFCSADSVAIADLDGDAKLDLAVGNATNRVVVLPGNGDGTFGARTDFPAGGTALVVADLNLDGRPDLVTNHSALLNTSADGVTLPTAMLTATRPRLVRLPLANPNPFAVTGNVTLRTASGKPVVTLGRATFALAAAKTARVRIELSKAGATLLAKRGKLQVRLSLVTRAPGAPPIASAKALLLKAAK